MAGSNGVTGRASPAWPGFSPCSTLSAGGVLLALVAPRHFHVGAGLFGIGTGLTAYTLGMRHASDADHVAAIDNTTRKLMAEGKRPLSVGFWFSLGHSTIVVSPSYSPWGCAPSGPSSPTTARRCTATVG